MLPLAAEEPEGFVILDGDGVGRNHAHLGTRIYRLISRVDALDARVDVGDGNARVVKVGLCHGMVTGPELKLHHCSWFGCDIFRPELEASSVVGHVPRH